MLHDLLNNPPREASLMPFWFWNDDIDAADIARQITDFEAHGVLGFVIHPRVGLPRSIGWMSDAMLDLMAVAIDEARRRDMRVILYDEGMYPSGSSSGQVVARDSTLAARCLALHDPTLPLPDGTRHVTTFEHYGRRYDVVDRKADSYIRGLHYIGDGPAEDEPPAGDILNPRTTAAVIELVYDRFAQRFGDHFGTTILGIFTDEPNPLGKCRERNVWPGSLAGVEEVSRLTGRDARIDMPGLWFDDWPNATAIREGHHAWIRCLLSKSWYAPLSDWCARHRLWLMGHPDAGDEIGVQHYFHAPGQDLVWRFVEPDKPSALEGPESTQAKCTSSAKLHHRRRRNSNEFAGAYGAQTTFDEVRWLARWCIVRGVDLLIPHAFYHSIRGPRKDERPPQFGPHTPHWDDGSFARFAEECRRLCALNVIGTPICDIAILTHGDRCPWPAAKVCFEHQHDFNYLEPRVLLDDQTQVDAGAISVAGSQYRLLIIDGDERLDATTEAKLVPLVGAGRVVRFSGDVAAMIASIGRACAADLHVVPSTPALRVRHLQIDGIDLYLLFNEEGVPIEGAELQIPMTGNATWIEPETKKHSPANLPLTLTLAPWSLRVLCVAQSLNE